MTAGVVLGFWKVPFACTHVLLGTFVGVWHVTQLDAAVQNLHQRCVLCMGSWGLLTKCRVAVLLAWGLTCETVVPTTSYAQAL